MGTTYLARNPDLTGDAVLTILDPDLFDDPGFRERFTREADAAAEMTHPNIASVYGHGVTDDGTAWIATEHIGGTDAETALRQGKMTPAKAVRIVSEVALALDYAHRRGMVHRDVRPSNFLLSTEDPDEYVVLSNFGNPLPAEHRDSAALLSAITYAAPEVLSGAPIDGRSDLYSLGGSLFRLLTGRTPFPAAEDPASAVRQHLEDPPPKVTDVKPKLPPALNTVVTTAMAKNPDARYQTGEEFAAALMAILPRPNVPAAGPPVPTPPPPVSTPRPTPPPPIPPARPAPLPIRSESRPTPASNAVRPVPSWHPDPDIEPSDSGQFPGPVTESNPPNRKPLKLGAAILAVSALAVGGVVWLTSRDNDGTATVADSSSSSSTSSSTTKKSTPTTTAAAAPATRDPAAETTLRGLLPAGYPPDACFPADPGDGARATFTCALNGDPGGPTAARYSLMPSVEALQRTFNKLASEASTVICPGNIMSPGAWRHNATPELVAGTVFCATKANEQLVAWSTDDKLLLNVASSPDGAPTLDQLFAWWGSHS